MPESAPAAAKAPVINITDGTVLSFNNNTVNFEGPFRFGVRQNITVQVTALACGEMSKGQIGPQVKTLDDLIKTKDKLNLTINIINSFSTKNRITS